MVVVVSGEEIGDNACFKSCRLLEGPPERRDRRLPLTDKPHHHIDATVPCCHQARNSEIRNAKDGKVTILVQIYKVHM